MTYGESQILVAKKFEASAVYSDNHIAYALRQSNMLYELIKVQGNTIVMIPSENLNSMEFGNLATTVAYLENTKRAAKSSQRHSDKSSEIDSSKTDYSKYPMLKWLFKNNTG